MSQFGSHVGLRELLRDIHLGEHAASWLEPGPPRVIVYVVVKIYQRAPL